MKKTILCAATGAMLLSTSAFATKARMTALGQDATAGSLYLDDTRNVFHNPAHLNNAKNYIVTEWGADTAAPATAEAEGGMFREMGSFAYGLYLGNDQYNVQTNRAGYVMPSNQLDLFFAGDMGVQWGARVHYASNKDERKSQSVAAGEGESSQSALGLSFGVVMGALDVYADLLLSDESEGTTATDNRDKWEADTGIKVGVAYDINGLTPYAEYNKQGHEDKKQADTEKLTHETSTIKVGVAKVHEVSSTAFVFCDANYTTMKTEDKAATAGAKVDENKNSDLSLTFGFESEANSWLTWRGAVSQEVLINKQEDTNDSGTANADVDGLAYYEANTTEVSGGMTLNFGKLQVDATLTGASTGSLSLTNFGARAGVHYWF